MTELLHIVVTCSQRKRLVPEPRLQLRNVAGNTPEERCAEWTSRLDEGRGTKIPARELYQGGHWASCRELTDVARDSGFDAHLWVCSTGYGFIQEDLEIEAYEATFDHRSKDSAGGTPDERRRWWRALSSWEGLEGNEIRSLEALARRFPSSTILLVASRSYLDAVSLDAHRALCELDNPSRYLIVSTGTRGMGRLTPNILPSDARLLDRVGGVRQTLNARVARELLLHTDSASLRLDESRKLLQRWLDAAPPIPQYDRRPVNDDDVRSYVRRELSLKPGASKTALLRRLRDNGWACEQKRFGALFAEVSKEPSPASRDQTQFELGDILNPSEDNHAEES